MEFCVLFQICQSGLFCTCMSCFISYNFVFCIVSSMFIISLARWLCELGGVATASGRPMAGQHTAAAYGALAEDHHDLEGETERQLRVIRNQSKQNTRRLRRLSLTWLWLDLLILLWHVGVLRLLNLLSTTCWSLIQHIQLNPVQIVQFTCDMCGTCALQLRKKWSISFELSEN